MKRFMIIGFALMLTAFTLEGKEAVIEIDEEETKTHKEAGRILYKYTMVNDVVNTFVEAYVNREMDEGYDYRIKTVSYSNEKNAFKYIVEIDDGNSDPLRRGYLLDVFVSPTRGVLQVKLRENVA